MWVQIFFRSFDSLVFPMTSTFESSGLEGSYRSSSEMLKALPTTESV